MLKRRRQAFGCGGLKLRYLACRKVGRNLFISHEYLMFHARFQPGGLFKLLGIQWTSWFTNISMLELVLGRK